MTTNLEYLRSRTKVAVAYVPAPTEPLAQFVGGCHWKIRNIEALARLLESMGYVQLPPEKPSEYSRLWKPCGGSVIIKTNGWATARSGGFVDLATIRKAGL